MNKNVFSNEAGIKSSNDTLENYLKDKKGPLAMEQILREYFQTPNDFVNQGERGVIGRRMRKAGWVLIKNTTRKDRGYYYWKKDENPHGDKWWMK